MTDRPSDRPRPTDSSLGPSEVERLRAEVAELKRQAKVLRQRLRREQADHQQTLRRLEVLRAALADRGQT